MSEQPSTCPGHPILYNDDIVNIQHDKILEIMGSHDFKNIISECLEAYIFCKGDWDRGIFKNRIIDTYRVARNIAMGEETQFSLYILEEIIDWKNVSKKKKMRVPDKRTNRLRLTVPRLQRYLTFIKDKVKEIIDMPLPSESDCIKFQSSTDHTNKHTDNIYKLLFEFDTEWYAPLKAVCVLRLQVPDCEGNDRAQYVLMKSIYKYMLSNVFSHLKQEEMWCDVLYHKFLEQERGLSQKEAAERKEAWKAHTKMKAGMCMIDLSDNVVTPPKPEGEEKKE